MGVLGSNSKPFNPERDISDLSGRVFLVTGGNTGLGKEMILQLAKHKPQAIYLAARTQYKADAAIAEIKQQVPDANIEYLPLDLTSFDSIKAAAATFSSKSQRLDVLVNNAGIMATPPGTTKDGYEIQFGTNHMGHAALTRLLLPILQKTAAEPDSDVRIVTMSSLAYNMAPKRANPFNFDTASANKESPYKRYGQSKLANCLYPKEQAKHIPNITSVAVHPGVINTDLFNPTRNMNLFNKIGFKISSWAWMSGIPEGAKNQLWAATTDKKNLKNGEFYYPVGVPHAGNNHVQSKKLAEELYTWTEEELTKKGF